METVFIIDDSDVNLLIAKHALEGQYRIFTAPSAMKMFSLFERIIPDIILLDIEMPEINGYVALKRLKSDPRTRNIPVIFLTGHADELSELDGFDLGAVDFISKPFSSPRLAKRVASQLLIASQKKELFASREALKDYAENLAEKVYNKTKEINNLHSAVLTTVADLVEFRDKQTGGHISRTQMYLHYMVDELIREGIYTDISAEWDMDFFLQSAQLHDVGKIGITDLILNKPSKLSELEFDIMKTHVNIGINAIEKIMRDTNEHAFLHYALLFAGTHHEKWDGSGYPSGLKEFDIPLEGRLLAIVDVYDALVSERPYKKPMFHEEAKNIIIRDSGTHFDPTLVNIFTRVADKFALV